MYSCIKSAANLGLEGYLVKVETHISNGLPRFKIVGLPDKSVEEAKDRVTSAIKSSGYTFPLKRITVNLAPSNIPKHGPSFDLPIATGILYASNQITIKKPEAIEQAMFSGELGLNGKLRATNATPIIVHTAAKNKIPRVILPSSNLDEYFHEKDIEILLPVSLRDCIEFLKGNRKLSRYTPTQNSSKSSSVNTDLPPIIGNHSAKRAAAITIAGRHHLALSGTPGCGKTLLAKSMIAFMPEPSMNELFEIHKIYSICKEKCPTSRPFRNPHHSSSMISILGGGAIPVPGEVTLSHHGILFLDEFQEFQQKTINSLRQPLEDHSITISRKYATVTFPCNFILVTAMNLCPCGFLGHPNKQCTCKYHQIVNYRNKIPNALWDRIDLHINLFPQNFKSITKIESDKDIRHYHKLILDTWDIQKHRGTFNNTITLSKSKKLCPTSARAGLLLKNSYKTLGMSTRGLLKILRVARTIADIDNVEIIKERHIAEAVSYRRISC
ncbi:MAG: YifB family Mg chelatase-like AAA ATPase [Patescibacteria group bacterium]|nr:YifB family Mg chelatase-like AAA ATPase [Patescibacteria group bacterium]